MTDSVHLADIKRAAGLLSHQQLAELVAELYARVLRLEVKADDLGYVPTNDFIAEETLLELRRRARGI